MQRLYFFIIIGLSSYLGLAQQHEYRIQKHCNKVDSIIYKVYEYEKLGLKSTGSTAFDNATKWLVSAYEKYGYEPVIDTFSFGSLTSYNVIIEKPGSRPNEWIIVGAHFDSKGESPGANDNGSGVVASMEIARLIRYVDTRVGVRIINFGAEEQGYKGSFHYVNNTLDTSDNIQLMINLDQLGGTKDADNSKIVCERDENNTPTTNNAISYLKTDTMANLISLYSNLTPVIGRVNRSDYMPFEDRGMIVTGLYQESDYSQYYHSSKDITANMDISATTEVIKGALATTLYFARISTPVNVKEMKTRHRLVYPNPASDIVTVLNNQGIGSKIVITNTLGDVVLNQVIEKNKRVNVSTIANGLYTVSISDNTNATFQYSKLIIAR